MKASCDLPVELAEIFPATDVLSALAGKYAGLDKDIADSVFADSSARRKSEVLAIGSDGECCGCRSRLEVITSVGVLRRWAKSATAGVRCCWKPSTRNVGRSGREKAVRGTL